jgi:hypothetical protein
VGFVIIENDAGLMVTIRSPNQTPEEVALANGGVVVDPGPFETYEDAYDAMQLIPDPRDDLHGE